MICLHFAFEFLLIIKQFLHVNFKFLFTCCLKFIILFEAHFWDYWFQITIQVLMKKVIEFDFSMLWFTFYVFLLILDSFVIFDPNQVPIIRFSLSFIFYRLKVRHYFVHFCLFNYLLVWFGILMLLFEVLLLMFFVNFKLSFKDLVYLFAV